MYISNHADMHGFSCTCHTWRLTWPWETTTLYLYIQNTSHTSHNGWLTRVHMAPDTPMLKGDIMDFPCYVCGVGFHPYPIMPGHLDHQMQLRPTVQLEKQIIFLLCIEILNVLKVFRTLVTNIISMSITLSLYIISWVVAKWITASHAIRFHSVILCHTHRSHR